MTLAEMRAVHEAATAGEWSAMRIVNGVVPRDARACAMYHNTYAKHLAVAEAAKAYVDAAANTLDEHEAIVRMLEALSALEEP